MEGDVRTRIISGAVVALLAGLILWFGGAPLTAVVGLSTAVAVYEWRNVTVGGGWKKSAISIPATLAGVSVLFYEVSPILAIGLIIFVAPYQQ